MNRALLIAGRAPTVPEWTFAERINARANWLRCGRTDQEIAQGKYSLSMAYGVLPQRERERLLIAHIEAGMTHYSFSIQDGPNRWWNLQQAYVLTPERAREVCEELIDAGLIPVPQLYAQEQLRDGSLYSLEMWSKPYAMALRDVVGWVWATFEHDESVHPATYREGLRGDDWITALAGRLERQWGAPIGLHQTQTEFHYYTKWFGPDSRTDNEKPPERPILLFQAQSWEPDPYAQAHEGDWRYVLQRCHDETGGAQICIPWEYCQLDPTWDDEDVARVGAHLAAISRDTGRGPYAYGNGG